MIQNAEQIWLETEEINQYAEIIHTFELEAIPENAFFEIYCETEYVAYINGSFAGSIQFKSFDNKRVYDSYDAGQFLKCGKNEIFVVATHHRTPSQNYATGIAGVAFSLEADGREVALSGEKSLIRKSAAYKSGEIEKTQIGYTYHYDASQKPLEWEGAHVVSCSAPFVPRPVRMLEFQKTNEGKICTQGFLKRCMDSTTAENMQTDYLSWRSYDEIFDGKTVRKNNEGVYFIIDLGDEYAGYFTMSLEANEGTRIDVGWGEHLDDMRVRTFVGGRNFAVSYICRDGKQEFTGYFRRFAGRYIAVHITNMTGDVSFSEVGLISAVYPLKNKEYFVCDDYFYNRLFDVSINTLKLCMHEHYEDCPWREQGLYAFDSFVQMRCGYYVFGEYEFARASLELMADGQKESGFLKLTSPGGDRLTIPSFSLCWVMSLQNYVLYSGDAMFAQKMLPVAKRIIDAFSLKDNLVIRENIPYNWYFYEWSDGGTDGLDKSADIRTDALINFYYILACESYNELCSYIGEEAPYDLEPMRQKCHEVFYDEKRKIYRTFENKDTCHELTQALAILSGVGSKQTLAPVLADENSGLVKITLSTSIYKYDALLKDGNEYLEFVTEDIAKIWGGMVYSGAKSLWETGVGADDFDRGGSLCHAWSAVPVYVLYRYHIGLKPTLPGFETLELNPCVTRNIRKINAKLYMPGVSLDVRCEDGNVTVEGM